MWAKDAHKLACGFCYSIARKLACVVEVLSVGVGWTSQHENSDERRKYANGYLGVRAVASMRCLQTENDGFY